MAASADSIRWTARISRLKLEHPDVGGMFENLRLPVVATGTLNVDVRLKDAGKLTQLDVDAKLGDISRQDEWDAPDARFARFGHEVRIFRR